MGDDIDIIVHNRETLSLKSFAHALVSVDRLVESDVLPYYRPLTRLSFLVEEYFFGKGPAGYHAVNILLHLICTLLFYAALKRFGSEPVAAFFAALLFGVHPVNAETVNFIATRNNMLATLFVLASFIAFLRAQGKQNATGWHILSGIFFFLGMLSKEIALMAIPLMVVYKVSTEFKTLKTKPVAAWEFGYILPHILLLACYALLRIIAVDNTYIHTNIAGFAERATRLLYTIPTYATLLVWPTDLTFSHTVPKNLSPLAATLAIKWCVLIIAAVYAFRARNHMTVFWILWAGLNYIPVSGLVPFPSAPMAERYMYLPLIGILALSTDTVFRNAARPAVRDGIIILLACSALVLGVITHQRNMVWKDDLTLSRSLVADDPTSPGNRYELAYELYVRGAASEAQREWEAALALDPRFDRAAWAYYYLALLSLESGDEEKGRQLLRNAVNSPSGSYAAQYALSWLLLRSSAQFDKQEAARLLGNMTMTALPLLPEFNSLEADRTAGSKSRSDMQSMRSSPEGWKFIKHYATGTVLWYDPASVQHQEHEVSVTARQLLSDKDRRSYALRLIRFPLARAQEGRFGLTLNCSANAYKLSFIEFSDAQGAILGSSYLERESHVQYEFLLPHTALRSLAASLCSAGRRE